MLDDRDGYVLKDIMLAKEKRELSRKIAAYVAKAVRCTSQTEKKIVYDLIKPLWRY